MTESADVVVIGGGVHGASSAFHLARRGARVMLLESGAPAGAATGRSSGLVRMHYDLAAESALAWLSFGYFADWAARVGGDCGFVRTGFVRIVPREQEMALRANVADQHAIGIRTSILAAADLADIAPGIAVDDVDFVAYEPDSGYADPTTTCTSLLAAARAHGATLRYGCGVEAIEVDGGRITGVRTTSGRIATPTVVLAAGAWSGRLAATCGMAIDIAAWHHDTGFVSLPPSLAGCLPTVIDDINALYFRPEGRHLALVGLEDGNVIDDRPDYDERTDVSFAERLAERLARRAPAFADSELRRVHGGTDGMSPDQRPMIGRHGPGGLILQCGFSGTGFKIAPAVGLCVSELVLDGAAHSADISAFDPARFERRQPLRGDHPYGDFWR